jgi:hypothetical protein
MENRTMDDLRAFYARELRERAAWRRRLAVVGWLAASLLVAAAAYWICWRTF